MICVKSHMGASPQSVTRIPVFLSVPGRALNTDRLGAIRVARLKWSRNMGSNLTCYQPISAVATGDRYRRSQPHPWRIGHTYFLWIASYTTCIRQAHMKGRNEMRSNQTDPRVLQRRRWRNNMPQRRLSSVSYDCAVSEKSDVATSAKPMESQPRVES